MGRTTNLPPRWRFRYGAYYFRPHPDQRHLWGNKTEIRIGATETEAWRTWFEIMGDQDAAGEITTMDQLFDAFWRGHVLQELAADTQDAYRHHIRELRKTFGHMRPSLIQPFHAYRFRHTRPRVAGNREVSVLSSALTYGVSIGAIQNNPLPGQIKRSKEVARDRLPTSDELQLFIETCGHPILPGYVALKRITGLRKSQLLSIDLGEQYGDGVLTMKGTGEGGKAGRDTNYHGETLEAVIEWIMYQGTGIETLKRGPLFMSRKGTRYTKSGFNTIWRHAMERYMKAGGEKFNEHDIRAVAASEAQTVEHAQQLLGHRDPKTTSRVYRRGAVNVEALKR